MITAQLSSFKIIKLNLTVSKKGEKKITKRVEERCVSVHGLYFVVDNVQFGVMNQINMKLICKWKMTFYANQEGNIYTVLIVFSFLCKVFIDFTAATAIP